DEGRGRETGHEPRTPNPERIDEVVINSMAAAHSKLHVGSVLRLQAFAPKQADVLLRGTSMPPAGPKVSVRVVGIIRFPSDLSVAPDTPDVTFTGNDSMYLTWRFFEKYRARVALVGTVLNFRVRGGASGVARLQAAVERISRNAQVFPGSDDLSAAVQARHATRVEALALLLFGVLAGLVTLTLIAQAFARQVYLDSDDYPALRAMGMTRAQLAGAAAIRAASIAVVGVVLAVGVAILASPRMPIGLARQAEIHPGISIDAAVFAIGGVAIIALLTGYTALVAWRAVGARELGRRRLARRNRPSRIATALTGIGSPPSATVGATLAFESGRGPSAVPTRTALASAALAMMIVTGALTFGANLTRVADRPRLQGWNWDVSVGNPHSDDVSRTAIPLLSRDRSIEAFSAIVGGEGIFARINGQDALLFGVDVVKGPGLVLYPQGRAPTGAGEIAFGTKTMREHHLHIGQRVSVSTGGPARALRITGRVLLTPSVVNNSVPLGEAAVVSAAALRALHAAAPVNVFLVRFHPGVDRVAALRHLRSVFPGTVLTAVRPPDIENLQRVSNLPTLLAILFALIAVLTIGNTLVSSVRRRGRELAVLRTLGFVRRQISAILAWQATTVAIIAIVIGLPLGVATGRWTWLLVTRRLGLPDDAIVPGGLLTLVALIALIVANLLALAPSLLARRTAPATILRTE
ncbi:MAG: putative transport system permease protein, partial [Actinomycetota bacterium]|nr:putative transport system permease protein [Actinomycetota bacterium]